MTALDLAALLEAVADKAEALRKAGVTELSIEGVSMKLAPAEPEIDLEAADDDGEEKPKGGLHSPDLYPGRGVPGRKRPQG